MNIDEIANDRNETIREIKRALKARSGKAWSVTGGRGTAWGWITIDAPPARRTGHWMKREGTAGNPGDYDLIDTGELNGGMTAADAKELARLLGKENCHHQGESIPASSDYRCEYIARARGESPAVIGQPYWD